MKFDATITLGQVIWGLTTFVLIISLWRDLHWRVKNVEEWQDVQDEKNGQRDEMISKLDRILAVQTARDEVLQQLLQRLTVLVERPHRT